MTLVTAIGPGERYALDDAVRAISWSPTGRLAALGADGRALIDTDAQLTAPIGPDPIDCCWIAADRVAVVDGVLGIVVAGGGSVDVVPVDGAVGVRSPAPGVGGAVAGPTCGVVVGGEGLTIVDPGIRPMRRPVTIGTGPLRTSAHLGGSAWLAGGAAGLVLVDVALDHVEQRIDLPGGVVSLASAPNAGRVVVADSTGAVHLVEVLDLAGGTHLSDHPDSVRHLDIAPAGDVVITCADDELTWWSVGADGAVAAEPERSVGHEAPITSCSIGAHGFVATGDLDGVVRLWSPRLRDLPLGAVHLGSEVTVLSWSPSADRLAIGSSGGEVVIADVQPGELV